MAFIRKNGIATNPVMDSTAVSTAGVSGMSQDPEDLLTLLVLCSRDGAKRIQFDPA